MTESGRIEYPSLAAVLSADWSGLKRASPVLFALRAQYHALDSDGMHPPAGSDERPAPRCFAFDAQPPVRAEADFLCLLPPVRIAAALVHPCYHVKLGRLKHRQFGSGMLRRAVPDGRGRGARHRKGCCQRYPPGTRSACAPAPSRHRDCFRGHGRSPTRPVHSRAQPSGAIECRARSLRQVGNKQSPAKAAGEAAHVAIEP